MRKYKDVHPVYTGFYTGLMNLIFGCFGICISLTQIMTTSLITIFWVILSGIVGIFVNMGIA